MRNHLAITLAGLALILAAAPFIGAQENGPEALIGRARAVVTAADFSRDENTKALVDVLDASLLILPKSDKNAETRSRIEGVKKVMAQGEIFSDKAYQDLGLAYKSVSGGNAWAVPAELSGSGEAKKGIELATKLCAKLLDTALAAAKNGRNEEAVRDLLGMVLLVVTPMPATR